MPPPHRNEITTGGRWLRFIAVVAVVGLFAGAGYLIWDLRSRVSDLESENRALGSYIDDVYDDAAQVGSDLHSLATDMDYELSRKAAEFDLDSVRSDVDGLRRDVCGYSGCFGFVSIGDQLDDLTDCVNGFIDAWASNGRTYYC